MKQALPQNADEPRPIKTKKPASKGRQAALKLYFTLAKVIEPNYLSTELIRYLIEARPN